MSKSSQTKMPMDWAQVWRDCRDGLCIVRAEPYLVAAFDSAFTEDEIRDVHDGHWFIGVVECRMCNERHWSAWPEGSLMEDCQECESCHNMTCGPLEIESYAD